MTLCNINQLDKDLRANIAGCAACIVSTSIAASPIIFYGKN